jgi:hypothetical protein
MEDQSASACVAAVTPEAGAIRTGVRDVMRLTLTIGKGRSGGGTRTPTTEATSFAPVSENHSSILPRSFGQIAVCGGAALPAPLGPWLAAP